MSLTTHRTLELLTGITLFAVPFTVSSISTEVGAAGLIVCFVLGTLVVGAALGAGEDGQVSALAHESVDRAVAVAGALAAVILAIAGEHVAALCCLVTALVELTLMIRTRYVARPGRV